MEGNAQLFTSSGQTCFWMWSLQCRALTTVGRDGGLTQSFMDSDVWLHAPSYWCHHPALSPILRPKWCTAAWGADLKCAAVCFWWHVRMYLWTNSINSPLSATLHLWQRFLQSHDVELDYALLLLGTGRCATERACNVGQTCGVPSEV